MAIIIGPDLVVAGINAPVLYTEIPWTIMKVPTTTIDAPSAANTQSIFFFFLSVLSLFSPSGPGAQRQAKRSPSAATWLGVHLS